ncbi:hypothetical protein RMATCC62417_17593 [Rhizopus microsporus]|nr:hypothetical protein RMATCC62417_17593 [Rhizopus microsporus]
MSYVPLPTEDTIIDQAGITEKSPPESGQFLFNFFTIQEPTKRRPILDCQKLNKFVQCRHFKVEGIPALWDITEEGDHMVKLDLKDVYVVVPMHEESTPFLSFLHKDVVYQYRSLAFGLSVAPRVFSKLMRYAMEPLRKQGIRLVYYLDVICLLGKSTNEMKDITKTVDFLGFNFNTKSIRIKVLQEKLNKIIQRSRQAMKSTIIRSCRWVASLTEKMTSVIPVIGEALLHVRHLQRDLAKSLRPNGNRNWEGPCPLSKNSLQDLQWWENWRNSIVPPPDTCTTNPGANERLQSDCPVPPHSRSREHQGRSAQPEETPSIRMETPKEIVQGNRALRREMNDRHFCYSTELPSENILELVTEPRGSNHRRIQPRLAEEGLIPPPTMETDSKDPSTFQETTRPRSNTGNTIVNNTVLVSYDLTDDTLIANCDVNEQALDISRLEAIK